MGDRLHAAGPAVDLDEGGDQPLQEAAARVAGDPGQPGALQTTPAPGRGDRVDAEDRRDGLPGRPWGDLQRMDQSRVETDQDTGFLHECRLAVSFLHSQGIPFAPLTAVRSMSSQPGRQPGTGGPGRSRAPWGKRYAMTPAVAESGTQTGGAAAEFAELYPVTVNDHAEAEFAAHTVREALGEERFAPLPQPLHGSEDFSRVLAEVPGAMLTLGAPPAGADPEHSPNNHSPLAEFDDAVLADGAAVYAELAARRLTHTG
ncbi:M20/M25/M40 family metallo-hydrolase [Streptomyces sp. DB-54]